MALDLDGVCSACAYHFAEKMEINWEDRKGDFLEIVASMKRHPVYDCVVPFSGGKDSATICHRIKYELGLRPLGVTYGQMLWTVPGRYNYERVRQAGIDCLYWAMDQEVSRALAKRFLIERGHPKAHYDAAINAVPVIIAKAMNIPLIVFAEHGETEYGGLVLSEESRKIRDMEEVLEHCVGDDARNWADGRVSENDLFPYIYPDTGETRALYWSYFFKWDIYENAKYARKWMNFAVAHPERTAWKPDLAWGRSDGSFEGFDSIDDMIDDLDFYLMYKKFGFGRATRMASRLVQYGHMTRKEGLSLVKEFDGEFPQTYTQSILEYLGMTRPELENIIDQHDEHLV